MSARHIFNILAVCGFTMFAGIMAHIGLSFGAYWKSMPPAAFIEWFAMNSPFVGRAIPIFVLPAFFGFAGSLLLDWNDQRRRKLWLCAYACIIGVFIITFAWHLPVNSRLLMRSIAPDQVPDLLDTWLNLHWIRVTLSILASILSLIAVSRTAQDIVPAVDWYDLGIDDDIPAGMHLPAGKSMPQPPA